MTIERLAFERRMAAAEPSQDRSVELLCRTAEKRHVEPLLQLRRAVGHRVSAKNSRHADSAMTSRGCE
jgi:hypothetical protein